MESPVLVQLVGFLRVPQQLNADWGTHANKRVVMCIHIPLAISCDLQLSPAAQPRHLFLFIHES